MSFARGNIPVTQAFDATDVGTIPFLRQALDLIDRVHTGSPMPRVIVRHIETQAEMEYRPSIPPHITIAQDCADKLSATIHCIGHLIDQFGFGSGSYNQFESAKLRGLNYTGVLQDWWVAVHRTQTIQALLFARDDPARMQALFNTAHIMPDRADLAYLVSAEELWARSYLQYITVKTRSPHLMAALGATLNQQNFMLFEQWPPAEFALIEMQIDTVFARMGWRLA